MGRWKLGQVWFFFPLTRFGLRTLTHVNFNHVNRGKITSAELKQEVERGSTFTLTSDLSCIALVELALAERDSKNAGVFFFLLFFLCGTKFVGHTFLAETVETGDENSDDFHCMQISLVISIRNIFGLHDSKVVVSQWRVAED